MRDGTDQRLAQQLGLGTHFRIIERAGDVEPLERGRGIRQHVVNALANLIDRVRRNAPEIDGDDAEIRVLLRHAADQPDVAGAVVHDGRERAARLNLRDRITHALRQCAMLGLGVAIGRGSEQHDLALNEAGQVLFDREIDVGRRRKPPREGIEIAHFLLAPLGEFFLPLHRICKVAGHHRHHHEQQEIDDLVRPREIESVIRRKEKISRPEHAGDRRDQRRNEAKVPAGEQHGQQIDGRAAADLERLSERIDHDRGDRHHRQRDDAAAQFASDPIHSNHGSSSCPRQGAVGWCKDNTPAPDGHPCRTVLVKQHPCRQSGSPAPPSHAPSCGKGEPASGRHDGRPTPLYRIRFTS